MAFQKTAVVVVCLLVALAAVSAGNSEVICVDDDAPPGGDGTCWISPFKYLRDALAVAGQGDEIRVAGGVYKPDEDEAGNVTPGDRTETFRLISGVAVYGGYAGLANPGDPDEWDIAAYETILSGDLVGDDGPHFENYAENSYHVVTANGADELALLDGFSITAGHANGLEPNDRGGGMFNELGSPTLVNCVFRRNMASGFLTNLDARGGGMYNAGSDPTLIRCVFELNKALGGAASSGLGGGVYNRDGSQPTLTHCSFVENTADGGFEGGLGAGGGMFSYSDSRPTLISCVFRRNSGGSFGGGLCSSGSSPTLINCLFNANITDAWADWDYGGGMYHGGAGEVLMINCTFFGNSSEICGGFYSACENVATLSNCIFWQNSDSDGALESSQIDVFGGTLSVDHTCIHGLTGDLGGIGNIGDDPVFLDADGADDIPGTDDDDLSLASVSPCIDAGDNGAVPPTITTDLAGNPRILGDSVDMGAYEFHDEGIPTVSEWGTIAMTLLLLTAGTLVLMQGRATLSRGPSNTGVR